MALPPFDLVNHRLSHETPPGGSFDRPKGSLLLGISRSPCATPKAAANRSWRGVSIPTFRSTQGRSTYPRAIAQGAVRAVGINEVVLSSTTGLERFHLPSSDDSFTLTSGPLRTSPPSHGRTSTPQSPGWTSSPKRRWSRSLCGSSCL